MDLQYVHFEHWYWQKDNTKEKKDIFMSNILIRMKNVFTIEYYKVSIVMEFLTRAYKISLNIK